MSKKRLMAVANYEVGYGKPPKETQFMKGQSGNPVGRPRGSKNKPRALTNQALNQIILDEAYRDIRVNEETGPVTMPIAKAVARSIAVNAAKGDHRSQKLMTDMVRKTEEQETALRNNIMETMINYIKEADFELERRRRTGATGPDIVPHPEDIRFNDETGLPYIAGPLTYAHKREFETVCDTIKFLQKKIDEAEEMLETEVDEEERAELVEAIDFAQDGIKRLDQKIDGWRPKN
jgi:hypothetical protein